MVTADAFQYLRFVSLGEHCCVQAQSIYLAHLAKVVIFANRSLMR
jgi:hypothetical protein